MPEFADTIIDQLKTMNILSAREQHSPNNAEVLVASGIEKAEAYTEVNKEYVANIEEEQRQLATQSSAQTTLNLAEIADRMVVQKQVVREAEPAKEDAKEYGDAQDKAITRSIEFDNQERGLNADGSEITSVLGKITNWFQRDAFRAKALEHGQEARAYSAAAQQAVKSRAQQLSSASERAKHESESENRAAAEVAIAHGLVQKARSKTLITKAELDAAARELGVNQQLLKAELDKQAGKRGEVALVATQIQAMNAAMQIESALDSIKDKKDRVATMEQSLIDVKETTGATLDVDQLVSWYKSGSPTDMQLFRDTLAEYPGAFRMLGQDLSDLTAVRKLTIEDMVKGAIQGSALATEVDNLVTLLPNASNKIIGDNLAEWTTNNPKATPVEIHTAVQGFKAKELDKYLKEIETTAPELAAKQQDYMINAETLEAAGMTPELAKIVGDANILDAEIAKGQIHSTDQLSISFQRSVENLVVSDLTDEQQAITLHRMGRLVGEQTRISFKRRYPKFGVGVNTKSFKTMLTFRESSLPFMGTPLQFNPEEPLDMIAYFNLTKSKLKRKSAARAGALGTDFSIKLGGMQ